MTLGFVLADFQNANIRIVRKSIMEEGKRTENRPSLSLSQVLLAYV